MISIDVSLVVVGSGSGSAAAGLIDLSLLEWFRTSVLFLLLLPTSDEVEGAVAAVQVLLARVTVCGRGLPLLEYDCGA